MQIRFPGGLRPKIARQAVDYLEPSEFLAVVPVPVGNMRVRIIGCADMELDDVEPLEIAFPGQWRAAIGAKTAFHTGGGVVDVPVTPREANLVGFKCHEGDKWCACVAPTRFAVAVANTNGRPHGLVSDCTAQAAPGDFF